MDRDEMVLDWIKRFRNWMGYLYPEVSDPDVIAGLAVEFVDQQVIEGVNLSLRTARGMMLMGLIQNWDELGEWGVPRETSEGG